MASNVNSANAAAYITSDRTELAPLCSSQQDTKGLRIITSFLTVFTLLVSMALMTQLHHGYYQVSPHGSVVSDYNDCSAAGVAIMKKGGSAVDAVISSIFCLSVVLPHLVGIGGGGYMMAYDQRRREIVLCLDFQPAMSNEPLNHTSGVGVPGFVAGLYQAHKLHGNLPWADLLNAAIEMAGSGFTPSASLLSAVPLASGHPELMELLTSGTNPRLFSTLKRLARNGNGSDEVYNDILIEQMSQYLDADDIVGYKVVTDTCQQHNVGQFNVAVMGSGSGGPMLLHLLDKVFTNASLHTSTTAASIVIALKETMVVSRPYSSGVNVVAADHNDIYVSAVSGLGPVLGSKLMTPGGYLMNGAFSSNQATTGNRAGTLATPVIITQQGNACGNRLVTGANDVREAAQLVAELLDFVTTPGSNRTLQSVSDAPRMRVLADQVLMESKHKPLLDGAQQVLLTQLNLSLGVAPEPYPSLNFIHKIGDVITTVADSRGGGKPASF